MQALKAQAIDHPDHSRGGSDRTKCSQPLAQDCACKHCNGSVSGERNGCCNPMRDSIDPFVDGVIAGVGGHIAPFSVSHGRVDFLYIDTSWVNYSVPQRDHCHAHAAVTNDWSYSSETASAVLRTADSTRRHGQDAPAGFVLTRIPHFRRYKRSSRPVHGRLPTRSDIPTGSPIPKLETRNAVSVRHTRQDTMHVVHCLHTA
jgi:hypothetical protein